MFTSLTVVVTSCYTIMHVTFVIRLMIDNVFLFYFQSVDPAEEVNMETECVAIETEQPQAAPSPVPDGAGMYIHTCYKHLTLRIDVLHKTNVNDV